MEFDAEWITAGRKSDICPVFRKQWEAGRPVKSGKLYITAVGVYEAVLNGRRVGEYIFAPGWTSYEKRLQYQCYDITDLLKDRNEIRVTVGKGWAISPMPGMTEPQGKKKRQEQLPALFAGFVIDYQDGTTEVISTDLSWEWAESEIRFSEVYDGETVDAAYTPENWSPVQVSALSKDRLIPQEGEEIREMERVAPKKVIITPAGETVIDFGQVLTGYVEFTVNAHEGDRIRILHGEVLDQDGNFYNANYRTAKAEINYRCKEGLQTWHPRLTFFGFRYLKLDEFPGIPDKSQFTAIVVYSELSETGHIETSDSKLNQLISNIFWGQKGNFLDVPTDCPQRDERLGWTGDAQVFIKTASYNYDVEKFFTKWLHDLAADQRPDGGVGKVIPDYLETNKPGGAGWSDAAAICPWQIYMTYGDLQILRDQFTSMKRWVDYITNTTTTPNLWIGGSHYGDWLALDAPAGSRKGSSRADLIASAYYAYSTSLVIRAGMALGENVSEYEALYANIVKAFREYFPSYQTQTEHVLAAWFELSEDPQATADALAEMIRKNGTAMQTGFIGTPYLLPVLSKYGHTDIAYSLLLRTQYPSWLYAVDKGATTVWEHWDGIMVDGSFWSESMNSFNHYAYGSVAEWIYETAAGIKPLKPGFAEIEISPEPDNRLKWLEASIRTRQGSVSSKWTYTTDGVRYEINTPVPTKIIIGKQLRNVRPGKYTFWQPVQ